MLNLCQPSHNYLFSLDHVAICWPTIGGLRHTNVACSSIKQRAELVCICCSKNSIMSTAPGMCWKVCFAVSLLLFLLHPATSKLVSQARCSPTYVELGRGLPCETLCVAKLLAGRTLPHHNYPHLFPHFRSG